LLEECNSELINLRCEFAALSVQFGVLKLQRQLKAYDPSQPRAPAGSPDGGQWTSGSGTVNEATQGPDTGEARGDLPLSGREIQIATPISPERDRECEEQFDRDIFHCNMVGLKACYPQAHVRYAACLVGHPIPPLNY
jgi:hypothetical protein